MTATQQPSPILLKRYARSRLYDTTTARYLTTAELRQWEETGVAFVVVDSETGDDITRILLA
jgi:polyhydroxyalkanoate synthesis regulator protein